MKFSNTSAARAPVRKLLLGAQLAQVADPDSMLTPSSMDFFAEYAKTLSTPSQR
jgi:hypothetical protein